MAKTKKRTALFDAPDWADMVALGAMKLGDTLMTRLSELLAKFGVTPLQYNVLRILYVRDEEREGLPVGGFASLLFTPTPDVSRLLDRLEKQGYIERVRTKEDRRVVKARLTDDGFALVEKIHKPLIAHHNALLARISKSDLEHLARDLARVYEQLPT